MLKARENYVEVQGFRFLKPEKQVFETGKAGF